MVTVILHRLTSLSAYLLSVDDLEPLLHPTTFVTPAFFVRDQWDVGMLRNAVVTVAAVYTAAVIIIAQVVIAEKDNQVSVSRRTGGIIL